jgi:ketosteroid isomerase-like protein
MSQENVEIARALYDEFAEGKLWTREYLFDPDVEYERRSKTADLMTGTWRGLEAMGAALLDWLEAAEDLRIEAERYIDTESDSVVVFTRHRGVAKTSGVPIDEEFADVGHSARRPHRASSHVPPPLRGARSRGAAGVAVRVTVPASHAAAASSLATARGSRQSRLDTDPTPPEARRRNGHHHRPGSRRHPRGGPASPTS